MLSPVYMTRMALTFSYRRQIHYLSRPSGYFTNHGELYSQIFRSIDTMHLRVSYNTKHLYLAYSPMQTAMISQYTID